MNPDGSCSTECRKCGAAAVRARARTVAPAPGCRRPPRISPRDSRRRRHSSRSRHGGAAVSRMTASRNTTPQRKSNCRANVSTASGGRGPVRSSNAQRPGAWRGRALRPRPSPRRRLGSSSERRFSNPSAVTRPAATSSHSASSISLASRPVARVRSAKKHAPRDSSAASVSRAACESASRAEGGGPASSHRASSRRKMARGATRVGRMPLRRSVSSRSNAGCGETRPHVTSPEKQSWSKYSGSYWATRRGSTSASHAAAGNSQPCNCLMICNVPSTPWS